MNGVNAVHRGAFAAVGETASRLAAIGNFQAGFDARVELVGSAFKIANVGAGSADDRGNFSEQAGAILGANCQLHRESGRALAAPFDRDAALGLVHQILHVWTGASVDGYSATTGDIADDFVAGNRIAALGTKYQQIIVAF